MRTGKTNGKREKEGGKIKGQLKGKKSGLVTNVNYAFKNICSAAVN